MRLVNPRLCCEERPHPFVCDFPLIVLQRHLREPCSLVVISWHHVRSLEIAEVYALAEPFEAAAFEPSPARWSRCA